MNEPERYFMDVEEFIKMRYGDRADEFWEMVLKRLQEIAPEAILTQDTNGHILLHSADADCAIARSQTRIKYDPQNPKFEFVKKCSCIKEIRRW